MSEYKRKTFIQWIKEKLSRPVKNFIWPKKDPTIFAKGSVNCWLKGQIHQYKTYEMQRDYCVFCGRRKRMSGPDYGI